VLSDDRFNGPILKLGVLQVH